MGPLPCLRFVPVAGLFEVEDEALGVVWPPREGEGWGLAFRIGEAVVEEDCGSVWVRGFIWMILRLRVGGGGSVYPPGAPAALDVWLFAVLLRLRDVFSARELDCWLGAMGSGEMGW